MEKNKVWDDYQEYLESAEWKKKREAALHRCRECVVCGNETHLVVHHLRYKNSKGKSILGKETKKDLVTLCWDCHTKLHKQYGRGASFGIDEIVKASVEYENERDEKKLGFKLCFTNGDLLNIDIEAKIKIEEAMESNSKISIFGNATIPLDKIVYIIREDTYQSNIVKLPNEDPF